MKLYLVSTEGCSNARALVLNNVLIYSVDPDYGDDLSLFNNIAKSLTFSLSIKPQFISINTYYDDWEWEGLIKNNLGITLNTTAKNCFFNHILP